MKKHILCFGDSNTHGYCADPNDCSSGGNRFDENERWTCLLQKLLGDEYLVIEEGLSGRTTVYDDPYHEGLSGIDCITPCLITHEPIDLLIIMLGTNDTKARFHANAPCISLGLQRLIEKAKATPAWSGGNPNILVIAPPHIHEEFNDPYMGDGCIEKSRELAKYYETVCKNNACAFLDAEGVAEYNQKDHMHLTKKGHENLAAVLKEIVSRLV